MQAHDAPTADANKPSLKERIGSTVAGGLLLGTAASIIPGFMSEVYEWKSIFSYEKNIDKFLRWERIEVKYFTIGGIVGAVLGYAASPLFHSSKKMPKPVPLPAGQQAHNPLPAIPDAERGPANHVTQAQHESALSAHETLQPGR